MTDAQSAKPSFRAAPRSTPLFAGKTVPRSFYRRDSATVAPELLNKVLLGMDGRAGRIVEVEAYGGALDPAAHSYRGQTPRNAVMFGQAGRMYVYFTYGMHWCCNAVCGEGDGLAVLIRALEPLTGLPQMRSARPRVRNDRDLCNGPAKLTQALGITGTHNGIDLVSGRDGFTILDDGVAPPSSPVCSVRIGISKAADIPWRWYVPGNVNVSR